MTATERDAMVRRLVFLIRIVRKEADHLEYTDEHLFSSRAELTADEVGQWVDDPALSERLDAFVTRFSRLQDTVGDKLIPALLDWTGEGRGPAIDNLDKAEKFGWIDSTDDWMAIRSLRNRMVHEYIEDITVLTDALETGRAFVPALLEMSRRIAGEAERRLQS